jgi:beta-mannanase
MRVLAAAVALLLILAGVALARPNNRAHPKPTPTPHATPSPTPSPTPPPNAVALGAYLPGAPGDPSVIDAYATLTGATPRIVMWYQQWGASFSVADANAVRTRGAMPLISWEPWAGNKTDPAWTLASIINGAHDAYIDSWTSAVAAWGLPIYVRPMYEMNGNWTAWSESANGNSPGQFVTAWRHIVDRARSHGATNIRWVWSPNIDDGNPNLIDMPELYPGDSYVDWLGLDGYNWGSLPSGNGWQTFTQVFQTLGGSYSIITGLSSRPLMISETACQEDSRKPAWITSAFGTEIPAMPRIKAVTWFNANKETDWRVNSSAGSLAAFRAIVPAYNGVLP